MTTRLQLTVNYKNGNQIKQLVNYIHVEDDTIYYHVDKQVSNMVESYSHIPMANVASYDLVPVECDGWKVVENG